MTQDFISFSDVDKILITCKSLKKKNALTTNIAGNFWL